MEFRDTAALFAYWNALLAREGMPEELPSITREHVRDMEATREYYRLATDWLTTYPWTDDTDRAAWALHAQGWTLRRIARSLKRNHAGIGRRIKRISTMMLEAHNGDVYDQGSTRRG